MRARPKLWDARRTHPRQRIGEVHFGFGVDRAGSRIVLVDLAELIHRHDDEGAIESLQGDRVPIPIDKFGDGGMGPGLIEPNAAPLQSPRCKLTACRVER